MAPTQDDLRSRALDSIKTALDAHKSARDKVLAVIALKDLNGKDTSSEAARRADLDVKIGNLEDEETEYKAAQTVVTAPTRAEITAGQADIQEIKKMAVADAALDVGLSTITDILRKSLELKNKNSKV